MQVARCKRLFKCGAFQDLILRYLHTLMMQISQTALCNRLHLIEERLCRWLLICHDRTESNELELTHELLSIMLGENRSDVTDAATTLQSEKLVVYYHGRMIILDRKGLEDSSCDCYKVAKADYADYLGL